MLWSIMNYIFFTPGCKLLLSKLQSLLHFPISNQFYQPLLLEMEKQLGVCIQYLHREFTYEANLEEKNVNLITEGQQIIMQNIEPRDYEKKIILHLKSRSFYISTITRNWEHFPPTSLTPSMLNSSENDVISQLPSIGVVWEILTIDLTRLQLYGS